MQNQILTDNEYLDSRFADTIKAAFKLGIQNGDILPLAKASTRGKRSRAWRITMNRVNRQDGHAFQSGNTDPNGASPVWVGQQVAFAAAKMNTPQIPPRRGNPIFGLNNPGNGSDLEPLWVQIRWGMDNGSPMYMLGNWPMLGGSVVVEGSFVEVFGGVAVFNNGVPAITVDEYPTLSAQVVPTSGLASPDAGELSITQRINLAALSNSIGMIPFTDGPVNPPGFNSVALGPLAAMPASNVYNTAPFVGWAAQLRVLNGFAKPPRLVVFCAATVPQFELRDNQVPDGTGAFIASPGDVGIVYRTDGVTGVHTITDLENLINTSTIIGIRTPSPNPAFKVFAGWTIAAVGHAPGGTGLGTLTFVAPTEGGAVYVPDFARRVRVWPAQLLAAFAGQEYRVPFEGPEPIQMNWYDDSGIVVDVAWSGIIRTALNDPATMVPPMWLPVPARATTFAVYQVPNSFNTPDTAFIHWRIAP